MTRAVSRSLCVSLCLSIFVVGCTTDLRAKTVGAVACTSEQEIDIVSEEQDYGGTRWVANCRGEQYRCRRQRRGLTQCVRVE